MGDTDSDPCVSRYMSLKNGSLRRVESSRGMVPVTKQVSAISGSEESRARTASIRSGFRSSMRSRFRAICHMNLITSFGAANSVHRHLRLARHGPELLALQARTTNPVFARALHR